MATLKLLPEAVADIFRVDSFLREKSSTAADSVSILLERAFAQLQRFRGMGRQMAEHRGFREWVIAFGAGAYVVRYRCAKTSAGDTEEVIVVRVWHSREQRQ